MPRFVERDLRAYLAFGILAHGFVRVRCDACGCDRLVAFSCKGRGFCPACGGRRMADTAAHLVDRVLPPVPVRQWVLSLPFAGDTPHLRGGQNPCGRAERRLPRLPRHAPRLNSSPEEDGDPAALPGS